MFLSLNFGFLKGLESECKKRLKEKYVLKYEFLKQKVKEVTLKIKFQICLKQTHFCQCTDRSELLFNEPSTLTFVIPETT